jgi:hypothetical protein
LCERKIAPISEFCLVEPQISVSKNWEAIDFNGLMKNACANFGGFKQNAF